LYSLGITFYELLSGKEGLLLPENRELPFYDHLKADHNTLGARIHQLEISDRIIGLLFRLTGTGGYKRAQNVGEIKQYLKQTSQASPDRLLREHVLRVAAS
jgi:hypothetical protein